MKCFLKELVTSLLSLLKSPFIARHPVTFVNMGWLAKALIHDFAMKTQRGVYSGPAKVKKVSQYQNTFSKVEKI